MQIYIKGKTEDKDKFILLFLAPFSRSLFTLHKNHTCDEKEKCVKNSIELA
jgi:hypothetical protein